MVCKLTLAIRGATQVARRVLDMDKVEAIWMARAYHGSDGARRPLGKRKSTECAACRLVQSENFPQSVDQRPSRRCPSGASPSCSLLSHKRSPVARANSRLLRWWISRVDRPPGRGLALRATGRRPAAVSKVGGGERRPAEALTPSPGRLMGLFASEVDSVQPHIGDLER